MYVAIARPLRYVVESRVSLRLLVMMDTAAAASLILECVMPTTILWAECAVVCCTLILVTRSFIFQSFAVMLMNHCGHGRSRYDTFSQLHRGCEPSLS
eukprot:scaffold131904_cov36-Tisochrysis_lutea.AAC.3